MHKLLLILVCLPAVVLAQDDKHITRQRDKYTDTDIITAKPNDVLATTGNLRSAVSLTPVAIVEKGKGVEIVALVFNPEPVTIAGGISSGQARIYFRPEAEAVLLVGRERFALPPADKPGGFSGAGRYRQQTVVAVPLAAFEKLAASNEWSIRIGDVIVGVGDPDLADRKTAAKWAERVQPRLRAFAAAVRQANHDRQPTPEKEPPPAGKSCFENGRKVACP